VTDGRTDGIAMANTRYSYAVARNKTKVMISRERQKVKQKAGWPRGVCGRGVGNNSIQCTSCQKWVHRKCSGIKVACTKWRYHHFSFFSRQ